MRSVKRMEGIREDILNSDRIVFTTPLYYYGMLAQLKTILHLGL